MAPSKRPFTEGSEGHAHHAHLQKQQLTNYVRERRLTRKFEPAVRSPWVDFAVIVQLSLQSFSSPVPEIGKCGLVESKKQCDKAQNINDSFRHVKILCRIRKHQVRGSALESSIIGSHLRYTHSCHALAFGGPKKKEWPPTPILICKTVHQFFHTGPLT